MPRRSARYTVRCAVAPTPSSLSSLIKPSRLVATRRIVKDLMCNYEITITRCLTGTDAISLETWKFGALPFQPVIKVLVLYAQNDNP